MLGNHSVLFFFFLNLQLSLQLGWGPTRWEKRQGERAWIHSIFVTWTQWRSCSLGWVSRDTVISMKPWWPCWMDSSHSASFRVSGSNRNSWVDCFLFGLWPFNHQVYQFFKPCFRIPPNLAWNHMEPLRIFSWIIVWSPKFFLVLMISYPNVEPFNGLV